MTESEVRVLLIDEGPNADEVIRALLNAIPGNKFDLETVRRLDAGLDALVHGDHDVVLLAAGFDEEGGLGLLREALRSGCSSAMILLTDSSDWGVARSAREAGASDCLVKGRFDALDLERSLHYALQHKRHAAEIEHRVALRTLELERANSALRVGDEGYRLVVEGATGFAIIMLDLGGHVISWNVGAERVFGYAESDILGRHFSHFFIPQDVEAGRPERELILARKQERADDDNWLVRADSTQFWASGATTALRDDAGNLRGYAKVVRDISDRKRAEEAVHKAHRRKDEFLAVLAHELRNPLAAITSANELARRVDDPDERAWADEVIGRQSTYLVRLVDDLLDVSRIGEGKIRLEEQIVELGPSVDRAIEAVRPLIVEKGHTLTLSRPGDPVRFTADPTRFQQILVNLLTNAAKYTDPGGWIKVSASRDPGEIVISVRDTGIGITPEMLPRIFEMFTQVDDSLDRSRGGLGIGLTLVKRLVELHGGSIAVASDGPGQGSEFIVRFPIAAAPEEPPPHEKRPMHADRRGSLVLVVDDNADTARGMAKLLKLAGHVVRVAHDGPGALEIVFAERPDAVLLDIGLPGMDGIQVAWRIRGHESGKETLLIAVSGHGQADDRRKTKEAGFDHHFIKPVDFDELLGVLSALKSAPID